MKEPEVKWGFSTRKHYGDVFAVGAFVISENVNGKRATYLSVSFGFWALSVGKVVK